MSDYLFNDKWVTQALDEQRAKAMSAVAELPPDLLLTRTLDDLEAEFVDRFQIEGLVPDWDGMVVEQTETKIDVSRDWNRAIFDRTQPYYMTGTKITYVVPFSGAIGLFRFQPSTHTMSPPQGVVRGNELRISYEGVDVDPDNVRKGLEAQVSAIKTWTGWLASDVTAFNADLPRHVRAALQARFDKVRADRAIVESLGVPLRKRADTEIRTYPAPDIRRRPAVGSARQP